MKVHTIRLSGLAASLLASTLLTGCASVPQQDAEFDQAQAAYATANNDPKVAQAAPEQLRQASIALEQSKKLRKDGAPQADVDHYAYLSIQQVAIAQQLTAADADQAYIKQAGEQRNRVLLQASQQQTQQAQTRANDADARAQQSQQQAQDANAQAQQAELQTAAATAAAATATAQTQQSQDQNAALQQQLADLNAKQTERGIVLTLGNVLFDTNKSGLKDGSTYSLDKLALFLRDNPNRHVMVEGYTDSTGNVDSNLDLSRRRADSVRSVLSDDGVNQQRIVTTGYGVQYPVATNDTMSGRQLNRRVEIVISDANGDFPQAR
jgi:outer membrane protein OmpA-like peptidoglycan-associated protein